MTIGKGSELEQMTHYSGKNIEQDLVEQILSTQPPKTLMRFKCVSKWWYDLISSPRFINKHIFNSEHNDPSTTCVLMKGFVRNMDTTTTDESKMIFSLLHFSYDNENGGGGSMNLSSVEDLGIADESLHIIGHCNGIVCLATIDYDYDERLWKTGEVYLWNPAIQDFKFLKRNTFIPDWSQVPHHIARESPYLPTNRSGHTIGFGYDPKSNDYKVVEIVFSCSKSFGSYGDDPSEFEHVIVYPPRAAMYTTETDSWRELTTSSLERETTFLWPEKFQLYLKGMCFWLGFDQLKEFFSIYDIHDDEHIGRAIISFDTSDEVFHEVLLPYELLVFNSGDYIDSYCLELCLTVWNNFVALFNLGCHSRNDYNAMWVMEDWNCWRKHLSFKIDFLYWPFPERPLVFLKSNEVLGVGENGLMVCYNFITRSIKYLETIEIHGYNRLWCCVAYVNSIVPVSKSIP